MTFFANQRLAVRLGVAFGALAVALAIVASIGYGQMGSLRSTTENLSEREMRAQAVAAAVTAIGQDTGDHLYVFDGDLKAEDDLAKEVRDDTELPERHHHELEALVKSTPAEPEFRRFEELSDRFLGLTAKAIAASRRETVTADEDRATSRTLSAEQVSASTQQTSASTQEIATSAQELARTADQLERLVSRFRVTG